MLDVEGEDSPIFLEIKGNFSRNGWDLGGVSIISGGWMLVKVVVGGDLVVVKVVMAEEVMEVWAGVVTITVSKCLLLSVDIVLNPATGALRPILSLDCGDSGGERLWKKCSFRGSGDVSEASEVLVKGVVNCILE